MVTHSAALSKAKVGQLMLMWSNCTGIKCHVGCGKGDLAAEAHDYHVSVATGNRHF